MILTATLTLISLGCLYSLVATFVCIELGEGFRRWCPLCLLCRAATLYVNWRRDV